MFQTIFLFFNKCINFAIAFSVAFSVPISIPPPPSHSFPLHTQPPREREKEIMYLNHGKLQLRRRRHQRLPAAGGRDM